MTLYFFYLHRNHKHNFPSIAPLYDLFLIKRPLNIIVIVIVIVVVKTIRPYPGQLQHWLIKTRKTGAVVVVCKGEQQLDLPLSWLSLLTLSRPPQPWALQSTGGRWKNNRISNEKKIPTNLNIWEIFVVLILIVDNFCCFLTCCVRPAEHHEETGHWLTGCTIAKLGAGRSQHITARTPPSYRWQCGR